MFKYVFKRIALAILTLFIILIFSYTLIVSFIGNPYSVLLESAKTQSEKEQFKRLVLEYDNTPVIQKIIEYFGNFFRGNFGKVYIIKLPDGIKTIPELFFKPLK
ncbi:UNVERIFIED_CONTAM: hypothetical protein O8I53_09630 [Campylobacter lari]